MLTQKVLENEKFNDSKEKKDHKGKGKKQTATRKEKRARCYICRQRGHSYWNCENKRKLANVENDQDDTSNNHRSLEKARYPEKVHVIADYLVEGSSDKTWDKVWYVSCKFNFHMCPRRELFENMQYKFKMVGKEETEKKFIFSYGIGDARVCTNEGEILVRGVQFAPEVSLNMLSYDLLIEQGFKIEIHNTHCTIKYMYDEDVISTKMQGYKDEFMKKQEVISEHNKYLEKYFESLDRSTEDTLVKGLEELKWDKDEEQDYVDDEYISWNGSLYALKVNTFNRFISFMNLIKKDALVFRNWEILSKKFMETVKWFYLVYLEYDVLDAIPPRIGVKDIDLLSLHKTVASLGGYVAITLQDKWNLVAMMQGLALEEGEATRGCYKRFIDLMVVYHETARGPWDEKHDEAGECSKQGLQSQKEEAVRDDERQKEGQNSLEAKVKIEEQEQQAGSASEDDFDVIV